MGLRPGCAQGWPHRGVGGGPRGGAGSGSSGPSSKLLVSVEVRRGRNLPFPNLPFHPHLYVISF